jgi:hypothetical protein
MEFTFPIRGKYMGLPSDKQPLLTSPDLNNMRPLNPKTGRVCGAQRPGLSKRYTQQIASVAGPVVVMGSVTIVS